MMVPDQNGMLRKAGAVTSLKGGWFSRAHTVIRVSPGLAGATYGGHNLAKMVINHELIHAYHASAFWISLNDYNAFSENATQAYSLAYARAQRNQALISFHTNPQGNWIFPDVFHWRHIRQGLINWGF